MRGYPSGADGRRSRSPAREVSVTAACMVIRRELFGEAGSFDERFATHYQDRRHSPGDAPLGSAQSLHAACDRAPRRERDPRLSVRPHSIGLFSSTRGATRLRGAAISTTARFHSRVTTTDHGQRAWNVLFVNYHDFANSAVHICNLAAELVESGVGTRRRRSAIRHRRAARGQPFRTLDFDGARNGALRFPDGGPPTLVHAWTPREAVRRLTRELSAPFLPLRRPPRGQRGRRDRRPARPHGRGAACRGRSGSESRRVSLIRS